MQGKDWKHLLTEFWAFVAVAVIAFGAGWLIGDLGGSSKTETVRVAASASDGGAAETEEAGSSSGAQLFTSAGCDSCHTLAAAGATGEVGPNLDESLAPDDDTKGIEVMIVEPNSEVVEGFSPNVMPQNYGQQLSGDEIHQLAEFLVESTPAQP